MAFGFSMQFSFLIKVGEFFPLLDNIFVFLVIVQQYKTNKNLMMPNLRGAYADTMKFVPSEDFVEWVKHCGMLDKGLMLKIISKQLSYVRDGQAAVREALAKFREAVPSLEGVDEENKDLALRMSQNVLAFIDEIEYPEYYSSEELFSFLNKVSEVRLQIKKQAFQYVRKLDLAFKEVMTPLAEVMEEWEENHNELTLMVAKYGNDCRWLGMNVVRATKLYNAYVGIVEKYYQMHSARVNFLNAQKGFAAANRRFDALQKDADLRRFYEVEEQYKRVFSSLRDDVNQLHKIAKKIATRTDANAVRNDGSFPQGEFALLDSTSSALQRPMERVLGDLDAKTFFVFLRTLELAAQKKLLDVVLDVTLVKKASKICEKFDETSFTDRLETFRTLSKEVEAGKSDELFLKLKRSAEASCRDLRAASEQLKLKAVEMNHFVSLYHNFGPRLQKLRKDISTFIATTFPSQRADFFVEYKFWDYARVVEAEMADISRPRDDAESLLREKSSRQSANTS